jgi:hypothetical protein
MTVANKSFRVASIQLRFRVIAHSRTAQATASPPTLEEM